MAEELAEIRMCLSNDMNVDSYCVMWLLTEYEKLQDELNHLRGTEQPKVTVGVGEYRKPRIVDEPRD